MNFKSYHNHLDALSLYQIHNRIKIHLSLSKSQKWIKFVLETYSYTLSLSSCFGTFRRKTQRNTQQKKKKKYTNVQICTYFHINNELHSLQINYGMSRWITFISDLRLVKLCSKSLAEVFPRMWGWCSSCFEASFLVGRCLKYFVFVFSWGSDVEKSYLGIWVRLLS